MTLARRSVTLLGIPTAIIFLLTTIFIARNTRINYERQMREMMHAQTKNCVLDIENALTAPLKMTEALGFMFRNGFYDDDVMTNDAFENLSCAYPDFSGFYGCRADKTMFKSSRLTLPDNYDPTSRGWYSSAVEHNGRIAYSDVYIDAFTDELVLTFSQAVYKNGALDGVISFDYPLDGIKKILGNQNNGSGTMSFILSSKGNFFVHDTYKPTENIRSVKDGLYRDIGDKILAGEGVVRGSIDGTKYVFQVMKIPMTGWVYVFGISDDILYHDPRFARNVLALSLFIMFVIIMLITFVMMKQVTRPLSQTAASLTKIASGDADLRQRIKLTPISNEVKQIVRGFNEFVEKLHGIISVMKDSKESLARAGLNLGEGTQKTSAAITQILGSIESFGGKLGRQSNCVEETAGAVNQIMGNIGSLESLVGTQGKFVQEASGAVEEMIGNISEVNRSVDKMASSFEVLARNAENGARTQGELQQQIGEIDAQSKLLSDANTVIASIASQTNMLAMNAAIEAAHAGDAGKGFAVVADEIRKLSETSSMQSRTIGDQLKRIQKTIEIVVDATKRGVDDYAMLASEIRETDSVVQQIRAAMDEQHSGSTQITGALHNMNDSTARVQIASREMAEGGRAIIGEMKALQDETSSMMQGMEEMSQSARKISETGKALSEISALMDDSISGIGAQVDKFRV